MKYKFSIDEQAFEVEVANVENDTALVYVNGTPYTINMETQAEPETPVKTGPVAVPPAVPKTTTPVAPKPSAPVGSGMIIAPIPGLIVQVKVSVGDGVTAGQVVAVMEAMKMENDITSPISGSVKEIKVQKGSDVSTGDVIMIIG